MGRQIVLLCKVCNQHFFATRNDASYCSRKCRENNQGLGKCSIDGCENTIKIRKFLLCSKHASRVYRGQNINHTRPVNYGKAISHPSYSSWSHMKGRCNNKNNTSYKNYGGRGITVCDRWDDFWKFVEDMGERPSKYHSIDRIDVNKEYSPENCRWATPEMQSRNTRRTKINKTIAFVFWTFYLSGIKQKTIAEWFSVNVDIVRSVIKKGRWFSSKDGNYHIHKQPT